MIYIDFFKSSMDLCHVQSNNCQGWSGHLPSQKDGHWSPTRRRYATDSEFFLLEMQIDQESCARSFLDGAIKFSAQMYHPHPINFKRKKAQPIGSLSDYRVCMKRRLHRSDLHRSFQLSVLLTKLLIVSPLQELKMPQINFEQRTDPIYN